MVNFEGKFQDERFEDTEMENVEPTNVIRSHEQKEEKTQGLEQQKEKYEHLENIVSNEELLSKWIFQNTKVEIETDTPIPDSDKLISDTMNSSLGSTFYRNISLNNQAADTSTRLGSSMMKGGISAQTQHTSASLRSNMKREAIINETQNIVRASAKKNKVGLSSDTKRIFEFIYRKGLSRDAAFINFVQVLTQVELKKLKQWFTNRRRKYKKNVEPEPTKLNPLPIEDNRFFRRDLLQLAYDRKILEDNKFLPIMGEMVNMTLKQVKQWRSNRRRKEPKGRRGYRRSQSRSQESMPEYVASQGTQRQRRTQKIKPEYLVQEDIPRTHVAKPLNLFHPDRLQPPEGIIRDGLDSRFLCCGCALDARHSVSCKNCGARFHVVCIKHVYNVDVSQQEAWECPKCVPSNFPTEPIMSHVSNTRGQFYYKGQAAKAVDRNTGAMTDCTVFLVGKASILLHFNSWSNIYNQWIPSDNPKVQPAQELVPVPSPKTPRPAQKRKTTRALRNGTIKKRRGAGQPQNTVSTLQPFQIDVLRTALSAGVLVSSEQRTHSLMARYLGIHEGVVTNAVLQQ